MAILDFGSEQCLAIFYLQVATVLPTQVSSQLAFLAKKMFKPDFQTGGHAAIFDSASVERFSLSFIY